MTRTIMSPEVKYHHLPLPSALISSFFTSISQWNSSYSSQKSLRFSSHFPKWWWRKCAFMHINPQFFKAINHCVSSYLSKASINYFQIQNDSILTINSFLVVDLQTCFSLKSVTFFKFFLALIYFTVFTIRKSWAI